MTLIEDKKGVRYYLDEGFEYDEKREEFTPKGDYVTFDWEEAIEMGIVDLFESDDDKDQMTAALRGDDDDHY